MSAPDLQVVLERSLDKILRDMARLGHPIEGRVRVAVAPGLRANATTVPTPDGYAIYVNPDLIAEGQLDGLLAHELSHVYRMDSKHPSHDDDAITAAYDSLPESAQEHEYQRAFVHHAINIVEDLYADGISFVVMRDIGALGERSIGDLLDRFVTDESFDIEDEREHRWDVTHDMVSNARGVAMLKRYATPADVARAEAKNARLLAKLPPDIARAAPWFQALFDGLPEDTTREAFTAMLVEYVHRFVDVAEGDGGSAHSTSRRTPSVSDASGPRS
jgi:hypothetical protein